MIHKDDTLLPRRATESRMVMPIEKIDPAFASKVDGLEFDEIKAIGKTIFAKQIDNYLVIRCKVLTQEAPLGGIFARVNFGRTGKVRYRLREEDGENFNVLGELYSDPEFGFVKDGSHLRVTLFLPQSENIVTILLDVGENRSMQLTSSTEFNHLVEGWSGSGFDVYPRLPRNYTAKLRAGYRSGEASNSRLTINIDGTEYKAENSDGPSFIPADYESNNQSWLEINLRKSSELFIKRWDNYGSNRELGLTITPKF